MRGTLLTDENSNPLLKDEDGNPIIKGSPHPILSDWRNDEKTTDAETISVEQELRELKALRAKIDARIEELSAVEADVHPDFK